MGLSDEPKAVSDTPQRNQNRILTYGAPIFIIIGVVVSGAYYYYSTEERRAASEEEHRIRVAKARITFQGELSGRCVINVSTGERVGCNLSVTPTDPAKRIMNFLVQFPVGFHAGTQGYRGSLGGASIDVSEGMKYLALRASPFIRDRVDTHNVMVPVPIIIYSTYEFEGQEFSDRSLYYLMYALSPDHGPQVIPINLLHCGRLNEEVPQIDFLIDPWVEPTVGFSDQASNSLMFTCGGYAWLTHVDRGQYRAQSDLSPGQEGAPRGGRQSYSLAPSSLRFQSASPQEIPFHTEIIEIGGPTLRNAPSLRAPPRQPGNSPAEAKS